MTKKIVCIDASFVVKLAISDSEITVFRDLWQQWELEKYQKIAPTLFYYEVTNAFHRYAISGELTPEEAEAAYEYSLSLEIEFYRNISLHRKAFNLAKKLGLTAAYDAHYLALAQEFSADFYTADKRLFNSLSSIYSWVKLASG